MTEAEWDTATDPGAMLKHLGRWVNQRKRRLFAVACCRRLQFIADDVCYHNRAEHYRAAVAVAERYADGLATEDELNGAYFRADDSAFINSSLHCPGIDGNIDPFRDVATHAVDTPDRLRLSTIWKQLLTIARTFGTEQSPEAAARRHRVREFGPPYPTDERIEQAAQVQLVRCLFAHPFHSSKLWHRWLSDTAVALAHGIVDGHHFERMPILADALEDAGCTHERALEHCQADGPHARGCWVLDAILERKRRS